MFQICFFREMDMFGGGKEGYDMARPSKRGFFLLPSPCFSGGVLDCLKETGEEEASKLDTMLDRGVTE